MSGFACPDCDGVLVQLAGTDRFRCRVGHAWTEEALLSAHGERLEQALWTAYRIVEEKANLARRMEDAARVRDNKGLAQRHADSAEEASRAAIALRELLLGNLPEGRAVRTQGRGVGDGVGGSVAP
jgi:two-component system chemotaxis response regulator CheB